MTSSLPHSPDASRKGCPCPKTRSWTIPFFAAGILAILANAHNHGDHNNCRDSLQADGMPSAQFNTGVHQKIQQLSGEVPEIAMLVSEIQKATIMIEFFDESGILNMLQKTGMPLEQAHKCIKEAHAKTFTPKDPAHRNHIRVYLSPHALADKTNLTEALLNELLNIYLNIHMPSTLTTKKWTPNASGRLDFTGEDLHGIGIDFTKECISGVLSKLILESYQDQRTVCSLSTLKTSLLNGKFHPEDPPSYAYGYFCNILGDHGFPVEHNHKELSRFYMYCMEQFFPSLGDNLALMCRKLGISVQS